MECKLLATLFFVSVITGNRVTFVDTAPSEYKNVGEVISDDTVEELENLRRDLTEMPYGGGADNEISISKSQTSSFSDVNGSKSAHKEIKNEVDQNGKVVAKVLQKIDLSKNKEEEPKSVIKTEIEIPSKGIHRVIENYGNKEDTQGKTEESDVEFRRARNGIDKMNSFSSIKYSPRDMAEYIFWTGDENGVALTIEEFLREGLMSRQEAITFLQSIKYNIDLMQSRYDELEEMANKGRAKLKRKLMTKEELSEKPIESQKNHVYEEQQDNRKSVTVGPSTVKSGSPEIVSIDTIPKQNSFPDQMNVAKGQEYSEQGSKNYSKLVNKVVKEEGSLNEDDYDEMMEKIRITGLLQKEYSLEEVIYELAKIMFAESLSKANTEAQKAVQKFSDFLQNQVRHHEISRTVQRKVLDVLYSALMNALSELPEVTNGSMADQIILDQNTQPSEALKHILMIGSRHWSNQRGPKEEPSEKTVPLEEKKLEKGVK